MPQALLYPKFKALNHAGQPLSGGKVYTYIPGTSSAKATYPTAADATAGTNANANPVVLDADGEADLHFNGSLKIVLKDASDVTQWTLDNIEGTGKLDMGYYMLSDYDDLAAAATALNALNADCTLVIDEDCTMDESVSFDAEVSIKPISGNVITLGAYNLTINGPIEATDFQWISATSTGDFITSGYYNVQWLGGDAAAVVKISNDVTANSIDNVYVYFPQGDYTLEATETALGGAAVSDCGSIWSGLDNLTIDFKSATLKQTVASAGEATGGVFEIYNCTNVRIIGGLFKGYSNSPAWGNNLVRIDGTSSNIEVFSHMDGGNSLAYIISSDGTSSGTKPFNTFVKGIVKDAQYGIHYKFAGSGHQFDIIASEDVYRGIFIKSTSNIIGNFQVFNVRNNVVNIQAEDSIDMERININITGDTNSGGVRIGVSDANAANIRSINISGNLEVNTPISAGSNYGFDIEAIGHVNTVIEDIDLSGLTIQVDNVASRAVYIYPDVAGTIRHITLPKHIDSEGSLPPVHINNTNGATIEGIRAPYFINYTGGDNVNALLTAGIVSDLDLSNMSIKSNSTSPNGIVAQYVAGLNISGIRTTEGIDVRYSTDIQPGVHSGKGMYSFAADGALAAGADHVLGYIPDNAIILKVWYDVQNTFTSATDAATLAIGIASDDVSGIVAAKAIDDADNIWDQAGLVDSAGDIIQDGTVANATTITTARRAINFENTAAGAEAITAGRIRVWWEYLLLDP